MKILFEADENVPQWAATIRFAEAPDGCIYMANGDSEEWIFLFDVDATRKVRGWRQLMDEFNHHIVELKVELEALKGGAPEQEDE